MSSNSELFELFVFYYVAKTGQGYKFGNTFVNAEVNRSEDGFLPEKPTGHMMVQIRAQIAVNEDCDEEEVFIVNVMQLDHPPVKENPNVGSAVPLQVDHGGDRRETSAGTRGDGEGAGAIIGDHEGSP